MFKIYVFRLVSSISQKKKKEKRKDQSLLLIVISYELIIFVHLF